MSVVSARLLQHSLRVILQNQQPGGGFLACPVMPDYQFSWFRDGAYIAYALTLDGIHHSAHIDGSMAAQWEAAYRFHSWCAQRVNEREDRLARAIDKGLRGEKPAPDERLNARYRADGVEGPDDWPEFQLDGAGTWLWSLAEYIRAVGFTPLPAEWERAVITSANYLAALWRFPCYDCWEERGDDIHTSTLGAIYAGLKAAQTLVPHLYFDAVCDDIRAYVLENCLTPAGELAKSAGLDMVDANLLTVALPHGLFAVDDPLMLRTLARIESELCAASGGVHRHLDDVYYGGGAWVLLDLWRAWYYVELGQPETAREIVAWVESTADVDGHLPEQVNSAMLAPDHYAPWVAERGEIANPLVWSHAMYLVVCHGLASPAAAR
jgi:GH15 family glucan-1,4-alpha-glucosidase